MPERRVFCHVPYPQLADRLPLILTRRFDSEIYFSAEALDRLIPEELAAAAAALKQAGLSCTIHSPFVDLNPGSGEPLLRQATRHRFDQVLDAAKLLEPEVMVFHPGYDRWRYGEAKQQWLAASLEIWAEVLDRVRGMRTVVAVENIFEEEPSTLKALLEGVNDPKFRHCFDVGHWNLFKTVSMQRWFEEMGSHVAEVHLHDNRGDRDDHAPPGEGEIDFPLLFSLLERYAPEAVYTLEAHSLENLERSLLALERYLG